ncbi:MAG: hypothetical protein PHP82_02125 [Candidatus ainarchaeum sp.]|nr:hypothetical protein [Candidatus ainarchaeum sp.]
MKKMILILLIVIFCTNTYATHCWWLGSATTTPNLDGDQIPFSPSISYNGYNISYAILPKSTITYDNFGSYQLECNNGYQGQLIPYAELTLKNLLDTSKKWILKNTGDGCAVAWGDQQWPYCEGTIENPTDSDLIIGTGITESISFPLGYNTLDIVPYGLYNITTKIDEQTVAGECGHALIEAHNIDFLYTPLPSLFVFGPAKETINFYDNVGDYNKEVFFTIVKDHPLPIKIEKLEINCGGQEGIECEIIDKTHLEGLVLDELKQTVILTVEIKFNKNLFGKSFNLDLDVNYSLEALNRNYLTSSKPTTYNIGLIDQQDFQVKIKGEEGLTECVSYDGLVGVTGPDYAPKINLTFAGDGEIGPDTCDSIKINGQDNNWVYCSQTEFIFSLANKIGKIIKIDQNINSEQAKVDSDEDTIIELQKERTKYTNFTTHIRDVDLSKNEIKNILDNFNVIFAQKTGLEEYFGRDIEEQKIKLKKLFVESEIVKFKKDNGEIINPIFGVGKYDIMIEINNEQGNDLFYGENMPGTGTQIINEDIKITVDFSNKTEPIIDWFFYRKEVGDITDSDISVITAPTLKQTNTINRGKILSFRKVVNEFDPEEIILTPTFAIPLFIKIEKKEGIVTNKFSVTESQETNYSEEDIFTYWSGFASNKGEGCEEISPEQTETNTLFYRLPDIITNQQSALINDVELTEYDNIENEDIEFLQTIIYAPYFGNSNEEITLAGKTSIYSNTLDCTYNNSDCDIEFDSSNSNYFSRNMPEIIQGIVDKKVCISEELVGANKIWILFWNEEELLKSLKNKKEQVIATTPTVEICGIR